MEIKKIYKTFESQKGVYKVAISNLSFVLPNKGLISIVGRSGSGKTTLLNIIGGLEKPTSGDIVINTPMSSWSEDDFARYRKDNVSFIFQEFNLLDHMSIKENFELAFAIVGEKYNKDIIEKLLTKFDLCDEILTKYPSEVSIGQKQRLAIIRAIVKKADIFLVDEPTGSLDYEMSIKVIEVLKEISKEKLVIVTSHDKKMISKYSDRMIELDEGKIVDDKYLCDYKENSMILRKGPSKLAFKTILLLIKSNFRLYKNKFNVAAFILSMMILILTFLISFISNPIDELRYKSFSSASSIVLVRKDGYRGKYLMKSDYEKFTDSHEMYKSLPVFTYDDLVHRETKRAKYQFEILNKTISNDIHLYYLPSNGFKYFSYFINSEPSDYNFELVYGRLPESFNEVAITLYQYESFCSYYSNIENYSDLSKINLNLNVDSNSKIPLNIVGVIDTNHEKSRYGNYILNRDISQLESSKDKSIYQDWVSECEYVHNVLFLDNSFYDQIVKLYTLDASFYHADPNYPVFFDDSKYISASFNSSESFVCYFDGEERSVLGDNEIIIEDQSIISSLYSIGSNDSRLELNSNNYRSLVYQEAYKYAQEKFNLVIEIKNEFDSAEDYAKYIMNNEHNYYDEEHNYLFFLKKFWNSNLLKITEDYQRTFFKCKEAFEGELFKVVGIKISSHIDFYNDSLSGTIYLSENKINSLISMQDNNQLYYMIYNYFLLNINSVFKDNVDFLNSLEIYNGIYVHNDTPYIYEINDQLENINIIRISSFYLIPIIAIFVIIYIYYFSYGLISKDNQKNNILETLGFSKKNIVFSYLIQVLIVSLISIIIGLLLMFILKSLIVYILSNIYSPYVLVMRSIVCNFDLIFGTFIFYLFINLLISLLAFIKLFKKQKIVVYQKD